MSRGPFGVSSSRLSLAELVQHDDELAALDLLDFARQEIADLRGELVADAGPLTLAHALDDALLGRLHREAPEGVERHVLLEHVADGEVGVLVLRLFEGDLPAGVLDRLGHLAKPHDADRALQLVHRQLEPHVGPVAAHQRRLDPVTQQVEEVGTLQLLGIRQLAKRGQHLGRTSHPYLHDRGAEAPLRRILLLTQCIPVDDQIGLDDVRDRERALGAIGQPNRHVLIVGHAENPDARTPRERRSANSRFGAGETPPVLRPPEGPLETGRRHLQHIARPDHLPGFQEPFEGPADPGAVVGRDAVAGPAVRAIDPDLQDGALLRPDFPEIDELEAEAGDLCADRIEKRVEGHRAKPEKKCGENSPTSTVGPRHAARDSSMKLHPSPGGVNRERGACGGVSDAGEIA
jgi:hypothetical protein